MTLDDFEEAIVNDALGWCQCDIPEEVDRMMLAYLRTLVDENRFPRPTPVGVSEDAWTLLRYMADGLGWTEHGGTVGGAWFTDDGRAALERLEKRAVICKPTTT